MKNPFGKSPLVIVLNVLGALLLVGIFAILFSLPQLDDEVAERTKPHIAMMLLGDREEAGWNHQQYIGASAAARRAGIDLTVIDKVASDGQDAQQLLQENGSVFSGPITDTTGELRVAAGETLSDDVLINLSWYAEGVQFL